MDKVNYYQVIEGSEMYYPWYVHKLENDIKVLRKILEWADECDAFDSISEWDENPNWYDLEKEMEDKDWLDCIILYAERWMDENEPGWRS